MARMTTGTEGGGAPLVAFTRTEAVLRKYGDAVAAAYRRLLHEHGHVTQAAGTLASRIEVQVSKPGLGYLVVALALPGYWKYVEWDTRPHWPPPGALLPWISAKPVLPSGAVGRKPPTPAQLDFLIRRKISREGTKGSHDLADAVARVNAEWLPRVAAAVAEDVGEATNASLMLLFGGNGSK